MLCMMIDAVFWIGVSIAAMFAAVKVVEIGASF